MLFDKTLLPNPKPFAHAPNALELPDGRLFVLWYCGAYEGAEDQKTAGVLIRPDGTVSEPHIVVDRLTYEGETWIPETATPILQEDGDIRLYFFCSPLSSFQLVKDLRSQYVKPHHAGFHCTPRRIEEPLWVRHLMTTRLFTARLQDFKVKDFEPLATEEKGLVFQGRALRLRSSEWVLPFHRRRGVEMRSARISAGFLIGKPDLTGWQLGAEIFAEPGCSEPAIIQLPSGEVLCYMRRPGLTRTPPPPPGHIWRAISTDGCRSFSAPEQTNLRNPDTGVDIYLGEGERLVLVFNDSYAERFPLSVGLSHDYGRTFRMKDVESSLGIYAYPKLWQTRDRRWHLWYSWNYAQIAHIVFDEAWLEDGRLVLG